jgi:hypothetical protein
MHNRKRWRMIAPVDKCPDRIARGCCNLVVPTLIPEPTAMNRRLVLAVLLTVAALAPAPAGAQDADAVKTKAGVPLKIVVRRDTSVRADPDPMANGQPVKMFEFFYVLPPERGKTPPTPPTKNDFYRVSTSQQESSQYGWIHKDDVVEWPHRQALGLRPIAGRDPALFYRTLEEIKGAYDGKGVEPFSREPASGAGIQLMPILEETDFEARGDKIKGYRVAYMHALPGRGGGGGGGGGGSEPRISLKGATLDVVFVVDATGSMSPFIKATQDVVAKVAEKLAGRGAGLVPVRFGLVAYRDRVKNPEPDWYVNRLLCDLESGRDHTRFQAILQALSKDCRGGDETAEDVLGGLKLAIEQAGWQPSAFKHIVLIGDASGHVDADDPKNPDRLSIPGLVAQMQPPGGPESVVAQKIVCHAIRIIGNDESDHEKCEQQFSAIAAGRDYPGSYQSFDPGSSPEFIDKLVDIIDTSRANFENAIAGRAPVKEAPGLGLMLDLVRASQEFKGDVPAFASGFAAASDAKGNLQLEPFVLVQRSQLELFRAVLDLSVSAVKTAGDPGRADVKKVVDSIKLGSIAINIGIDKDTPISELLRAVLGFPVKNKIFEVTPEKLAAMSAADFEQFIKEVEISNNTMKGFLDNPKIWLNLGKNDPKPQNQQAFLKLADLP